MSIDKSYFDQLNNDKWLDAIYSLTDYPVSSISVTGYTVFSAIYYIQYLAK